MHSLPSPSRNKYQLSLIDPRDKNRAEIVMITVINYSVRLSELGGRGLLPT